MDLNTIKSEIDNCLSGADLENIRIKYLGRSGLINQEFSKIKSATDPKAFGQQLNQLKTDVENLISEKSKTVSSEIKNSKLKISNSNFVLPKIGHLHPITITERQLNEVFRKLGFSIYNSPEIVTDEYNFERMNVPKNHPSRDMQDTIYIHEPEHMLRTQTSTIESYLLKKEANNLPIRAAFPGSVYRNEKVNHSNHFVFHQSDDRRTWETCGPNSTLQNSG